MSNKVRKEDVKRWFGDASDTGQGGTFVSYYDLLCKDDVMTHRGKTDDETQNKWDEEERKFRESVNRGLSEMDGGYYPDYDETTESLTLPPPKLSPPCECGADKCELPYHSHWCPKAKEGV